MLDGEKLVEAYVQAIFEAHRRKAERNGDDKDDVFNEDEKVFSEKMNRWARESTDNDNDNDNDTLREVPHLSNEGLASQARV